MAFLICVPVRLVITIFKREKMLVLSANMICGRPFSCQTSQSNVDSKLGRTIVISNLQSAPEPLMLDTLPVSKHVRQICGSLLKFLTSGDLDL